MISRIYHIPLVLALWLALPVMNSSSYLISAQITHMSGSSENATGEAGFRHADTYSFEFRGEPLQNVIETIARVTKSDMMYDPVMIGDEIIYRRIRDLPMPDLLSEVFTDTPFDYIILSSGTIVVVRKVSDEPAFGTFSGTVRDSHTGKPLYGATVLLADASGGTATNRNGNFSMGQMMSGSYRIIFSYIGYQPLETVIEIQPDERVETEISLDPGILTFVPVVVRAHKPNLAGIHRSSTMSSMDSWEITGYNRDAIRSLSLFPGLQYGLPMQDIHLQGGRQGEHRIRLDGVPVYNPYHFGHLYSAFSPIALGDIELHKAGFGAEQGSMISGIIDFQHDIPYEKNHHGIIMGDPVNVNVRGNLNLPFRTGSRISNDTQSTGPAVWIGEEPSRSPFALTATFRSNFWDLYQDPVMKQTLRDWDYIDPVLTNHLLKTDWEISNYHTLIQNSDIRYLDGHFAFRYEPDKYNTIRSSFYMGQNFIRSTQLGEGLSGHQTHNYLFAADQYSGSHLVSQISWDTSPDPRTNIATQIGFSTNQSDNLYHMKPVESPSGYAGIGDDDHHTSPDAGLATPSGIYRDFSMNMGELPSHAGTNRIDHGFIRTGLSYSMSPQLELESGLEYNLVSSEVDFSDFFYSPVHSDERSSYGAMYLNFNRQFGNYWQMKAGTRATQTSIFTLYWEPRLSIQYDRPDSRIGYWSGRIAGGLYRQYIHQYEITNVGPTSLIPSYTVWSHATTTEPPKAYHLSGSWINKPTFHTSIKLNTYFKWEPTGYTTAHSPLMGYDSVDRSSAAAFSTVTRLHSWGASVRLYQYLADTRIQMMLGYDYSHSELEISHFNRVLPAPWNEPHRLQARSVLNVLGPVSILANWKSVYGRTWGFRQAYYDYLYLGGIKKVRDFSFENPEKHRLSPFHQLDLSVLFRPAIYSTELDFRIDLINVLNRKNVIDWSLQTVTVENEAASGETEAEYRIRERTMPGFYPTFRIEIRF